jgi:hypothetical protein
VAPERLDGVQLGRVGRQVDAGDARSHQGREPLARSHIRCPARQKVKLVVRHSNGLKARPRWDVGRFKRRRSG